MATHNARAYAGAGAVQKRRSPHRLPPASATYTGSHGSAREQGRKKRAAAKLVAGDSSGEASGATAFTSPVCIYWNHLLKQ